MESTNMKSNRTWAGLTLLAWTLACGDAPAAVTLIEETFPDSDWASAIILDSTPGSNAVSSSMQIGSGGSSGEFRQTDMTVTGPGGVVITHFSPLLVYDPSTGAVARIQLTVDGRFLGGSAGTSVIGIRILIEQSGTLYSTTGTIGLAVAEGPGNGQPGPWMRFNNLDALSDSDWVVVGGGPAMLDYSTNGGPIKLGYLTTTSEAFGNPLSVTCGVDRVAYTIISPNDVDLKIAKNAAPIPAIVGSNLTYTITVTNAGPGTASNVVVTDTVPDGTTFVSVSTGCSELSGTITCNLGTLTDGQSTNVTVVVIPTMAGTVTNTASVSADEADVFPADNSDTDPVTVNDPVPMGDDLTVEVDADDFACVAATKGTTCTTTGTIALLNNGVEYGMADFDLSITDSTKPGKPPKIKFALTITNLTFDLGANPSATLNVYLSDDPVFDAGDTPLIQAGKEPTTAALDALAQAFKTPKLKIKIPKGAGISGKFLLVVIDPDNQVVESDDNNNAAALGPLP